MRSKTFFNARFRLKRRCTAKTAFVVGLTLILLISTFALIEGPVLPLETPDSRTVVIFEPYTWHLGPAYDLGAKASAHNYSVQRYTDGESTITAFRNAIEQPADVAQRRNGIIHVFSHGASDSISIEAFKIADKFSNISRLQAETERNDTYDEYIAANYTDAQIDPGYIPDDVNDDGDTQTDEDPADGIDNDLDWDRDGPDDAPGWRDVDDDGNDVIDDDTEYGYGDDDDVGADGIPGTNDDGEGDGIPTLGEPHIDEDPDVVAFDIAVTSQFIASYAKNLPNSLVFISSCNSYSGNLPGNFIAASAHNYIGYEQCVSGIGPDTTFWNKMWNEHFNVGDAVDVASGGLTAHIPNDEMVLYHKGKLIEVSRPPDNELYVKGVTLTFKVEIENTGKYADVYQTNFEIFDENDQSLGSWEGKTGVSVPSGSTSDELTLNWPLDSAHCVDGDGIYKVILGLWKDNPDYASDDVNQDNDKGEGEDRILHILGKTAAGIFIWVYKITEVYPFVASPENVYFSLRPGETGSKGITLKNIGTYFEITNITVAKAGPSWISVSTPPSEIATGSEWAGTITAGPAPDTVGQTYIALFAFTGKIDPEGTTVMISVEAVIDVEVFVVPEFSNGVLPALVLALCPTLFFLWRQSRRGCKVKINLTRAAQQVTKTNT